MSFVCRCGHRIPTNQTPSPDHGSLLSDRDYDEHLSKGIVVGLTPMEHDESLLKERLFDAIFDCHQDVSRAVIVCGVCGRLHLQAATGSSIYRSYRPETSIGDRSDTA